MVRLSSLRVNMQDEPVGIENIEQFSWTIISDRYNVKQESYELQIATDSRFRELYYDSGIIHSRESVHVTIPDNLPVPKSSFCYYVRVRICTEEKEQSEWYESFFVTALQSKEEWNAAFISPETEADKETSKGYYLRKDIEIEGNIKYAYAHATALGIYHFYINGEKVGKDYMAPGWTSYNKRLLYQTYDITHMLQQGVNTLGAFIGAGWYKGLMGNEQKRNHYGTREAFACQIYIVYEDDTIQEFLTDRSWKAQNGPVVFSEIYDGEVYDARLEIQGWNRPGCDISGWRGVDVVDFPKQVLEAQAGCRVHEMEKLSVKRIFETSQGDIVIDFGQNLTGWVEIRTKGKTGAKIELNCFEVLDAQGNVYTENLRSAKETLIYYCKGEEEISYKPYFTFQGFQYVKIADYPGIPKAEDFVAYAVHSDMRLNSKFECSDKNLNQLYHNILWGMKGNFLDIPTDCPQRDERLGWTGDAQIFCGTATYLMDTYTFYRKWLKDLAVDQTKEGGVPHVIPDIWTGKPTNNRTFKQGTHSAAAWADAAVIIPWTLYQMYGDTLILEKQYDSMKAWIDFMRNHSQNYIWNYKLQFGDWVALDAEEGSYYGATPNELTCTAYFAYVTGLFVKIARSLGYQSDAEEYGGLYEEIKKVYQNTFFDKNGRLKTQTQTAQIITLHFDLAPEEYRENVVSDLLRLLTEHRRHLVTGFVGTPYFCHALSQNHQVEAAYELLLKEDYPSWLFQVKMGATTIWEHWDGKKPDGTMWSPRMNSFNHYAYGAVGEWIFRNMAGLECDERAPGFRHFLIKPEMCERIQYVKYSFLSPYGEIDIHWKRNGIHVQMEVTIPCNATATISICGRPSAGSTFRFEHRDGRYEVEVGSGRFYFQYDI